MSTHNIAATTVHDIVSPPPQPVGDAVRSDALRLLLTRFSVSPKHLVSPGPSDDELAIVALAALRGPDHDKLIPFRFVVVRGERLNRLADLFVDYGRRRGKAGEELEDERRRATQAPLVVAVVARIDEANADVPAHEQWAAVGAAISNALTALHFLGYAAKMLSGLRAADPVIREAFCDAGETLLGWISVGTPDGPAKPRGEIDPAAILSELNK